MEFIVTNERGKVIQRCTEEINVLARLTEELFNRYIAKSKETKQAQYQYNQKDTQKIIFIYKNNYRVTFYNIPTKQGYFYRDKIIREYFNK